MNWLLQGTVSIGIVQSTMCSHSQALCTAVQRVDGRSTTAGERWQQDYGAVRIAEVQGQDLKGK